MNIFGQVGGSNDNMSEPAPEQIYVVPDESDHHSNEISDFEDNSKYKNFIFK